VRKLPELTPEFLKTLGESIKSVDDLKNLVRADLEQQAAEEVKRALNSEIVQQVVTRNAFELPASLVSDYLKRLKDDLKKSQPDITQEEVDRQYKEIGVRQVRWEFLYHAIAAKEQIEVTDEDVDAWLGRFAAHQGITLDEAKAQLSGSGRVARIKDNLFETKVLDFLLEKATVTEGPVQSKLIQPPGAGPQSGKRG